MVTVTNIDYFYPFISHFRSLLSEGKYTPQWELFIECQLVKADNCRFQEKINCGISLYSGENQLWDISVFRRKSIVAHVYIIMFRRKSIVAYLYMQENIIICELTLCLVAITSKICLHPVVIFVSVSLLLCCYKIYNLINLEMTENACFVLRGFAI